MTPSQDNFSAHWSVRNRLVLLLVVAMLGLWGIASLSIYQQAEHESRELFDESLKETAYVLLTVIEHEIAEHGTDFVEQLIGETNYPNSHYLRFQVWDHQRRLIYRSVGAPTTPMLAADGGYAWVSASGESMRTYAAWNAEHTLQIQIAEPMSHREEVTQRVLRRLLLFAAIFLPCAVLFMWWIIARSFAPIQWISNTVRQRTADDLDAVNTRAVPREIAPLIAAMNRLLGRVRETLDHERRFTADAAHELRTPLAAIRAHAQVLAGARNPGEAQEAAQDIITGVDRSGRLVDQLLALARLEAHRPELVVSVDLENLIMAQLEAHQALATRLQIKLTAQRQPATVRGREEALQILLRNLLDNALHATPPGGEVRVSCGCDAQGAWLAVHDSGVGIPPEERERIFDRFYRIAGSRYTGSGLGLSIVGRVVAQHGARMEIGPGLEGRGIGMVVRFPLTTSAATAGQ